MYVEYIKLCTFFEIVYIEGTFHFQTSLTYHPMANLWMVSTERAFDNRFMHEAQTKVQMRGLYNTLFNLCTPLVLEYFY